MPIADTFAHIAIVFERPWIRRMRIKSQVNREKERHFHLTSTAKSYKYPICYIYYVKFIREKYALFIGNFGIKLV